MSADGPMQSRRELAREYSWITLALALIAGSVDAIGYLLLAKIFTSHMSGNTVAMTIPLARGDWNESWRHFEPIVGFFAGVVFGLTLVNIATHARLSRMFALVGACEVALLLAFLALAHPPQEWTVVLPAGAMGIQNALLRRAGHHRVRTTFVTGMLTNAAQGLVEAVALLITHDTRASGKFRDFCFYGAIWFFFAGGGIAGAFLDLTYGPIALALPVAAIGALIVLDLSKPVIALEKT